MDCGGLEARDSFAADACRDEVWLLGQPPLQSYLRDVRKSIVGGESMDPRQLCDAWRAANDYYHELEETEAGLADGAECNPLDPELVPLAEQLERHPHFRRTYDTMPTRFGMVELDRLVTFQQQVTLTFSRAVQARLGPTPTPQAVFGVCFPHGGSDTPVQSRRINSRRFIFSSESMDFRFQRARLLAPDDLPGYGSSGPIGAVLGLAVGFSSNFLNVISDGNRMLLHNGYHRAHALRALGLTHAPCIIQTVTRRDELAVVASERVNEAAAFYFKSARPPLFKDFFDPRIAKEVRVHRVRRMIEISFKVREYELPD